MFHIDYLGELSEEVVEAGIIKRHLDLNVKGI